MSSIQFNQLHCSNEKEIIRQTATKCMVSGEYENREDLSFIRKKFGQIKIEWKGHIPIESEESRRCDMGHKHKLIKDQKWVWNYATLSRSDAKRLGEFLLGVSREE